MMRKRITKDSLDRLLSAVEKDILEASDEEILQETTNARRQAQEVRALVDQEIKTRASGVPREARARRRWLAELLRVRPALAPAMSATFSDGKTPSDDEVDELIETLLRRGVLKHKK